MPNTNIQLEPGLVTELLAYLNERPYGQVRLFVGGIVGAIQARDQSAAAEVVRNAEARGKSRAMDSIRAAKNHVEGHIPGEDDNVTE